MLKWFSFDAIPGKSTGLEKLLIAGRAKPGGPRRAGTG
jgi:hypothetical protein